MRINNNLMAMNTHRMLGINQSNTAKSVEKLSSGLRINRAGDDAAGLAISEKMRAQIKGLDQASRNSQDAISLIQTAEGALNETHAITQRMRELAVQSATDTNASADRDALQNEFDELTKEISRIGESTEFNTQELLTGDFDGTFQIGANEGQNISLEIDDMRANALDLVGTAKSEVEATIASGGSGAEISTGQADGTYTIEGTNLKDAQGTTVATSNASGTIWTGAGANADTTGWGDDTVTFEQGVDTGTITISATGTVATGTTELATHSLEAGEYTVNYASGASTLSDGGGAIIATSVDDKNFLSVQDGTTNVLTLDVGTTAGMDISVGGIDISTQANADAAITTVNNALENISSQRSNLGAVQNRLEHTIKNLNVGAENLQAAESRIRDVDMAKEMMEFTKNNILQQAAQSMLAQANQQPQGVLQLLR
jgi:flagellin